MAKRNEEKSKKKEMQTPLKIRERTYASVLSSAANKGSETTVHGIFPDGMSPADVKRESMMFDQAWLDDTSRESGLLPTERPVKKMKKFPH